MMFGALIDGQQAEYGTLMLGEMDIETRQRVFAVRVRLDGKPHCLVVPETGRAFVPSAAWLNEAMWDVSNHAEFGVDPQKFTTSHLPPEHGEIAYADGDWLIPANTDQRRPERLHWISVSQGVPIDVRGPMLRFPEWRLMLKSDHKITLFKQQPPVAAPWLIAS